jgi:uncharacterized lipoprotein YddW (UPF0748 family)
MKLKHILFFLIVLLLASCSSKRSVTSSSYPKREFRGAWIQAVNGQFSGMGEQEMKEYLIRMLDNLQKVNVNAVLFQVRVEGDALYPSEIEPWSRFITGVQGRTPGWDPLAFMIEECHSRNMELHAWINPYRARTKGTKYVAPTHFSKVRPGNFVEYEGQLYFNPALQSNRDHICRVVTDILTRYDVDGLHIDDYFYPYPSNGKEFNDNAQYPKEHYASKGEWRRENVNHLIYQLHRTVKEIKPWVKFGVSPFGIYRNVASDPKGSRTKGLQCYDDLNADVLLWIEEGWVDYCIPQVYWEIGHKAADYEELVGWWAKHASERPLYIGQDVQRTVKAKDASSVTGNQQAEKYRMQFNEKNIKGTCFWDALSAADNVDGYRDYLAENRFKYPALMPEYDFIDDVAPMKLKGVRVIEDEGKKVLVWLHDGKANDDVMNRAYRYVVYRFGKNEKIRIDDPSRIVAVTANGYYEIPEELEGDYVYAVTVLDRMQNESEYVKCKVEL